MANMMQMLDGTGDDEDAVDDVGRLVQCVYKQCPAVKIAHCDMNRDSVLGTLELLSTAREIQTTVRLLVLVLHRTLRLVIHLLRKPRSPGCNASTNQSKEAIFKRHPQSEKLLVYKLRSGKESITRENGRTVAFAGEWHIERPRRDALEYTGLLKNVLQMPPEGEIKATLTKDLALMSNGRDMFSEAARTPLLVEVKIVWLLKHDPPAWFEERYNTADNHSRFFHLSNLVMSKLLLRRVAAELTWTKRRRACMKSKLSGSNGSGSVTSTFSKRTFEGRWLYSIVVSM